MNHLVILDAAANEIENLVRGAKSMIIHGGDVKSNPYGIVAEGDVLYFIDNSDSGEIKAKGIVSSFYNSYKLSAPESFEMIIRNQHKLVIPVNIFYKWAGKSYLVLTGVREVEEIHHFTIDRSFLLNTDD